MPLVALSLGTLLLALAVTANPTVYKRSRATLPMTRHVNEHSTYNILQRDQARAQRLMTRGSVAPVNAEQSNTYNEDITNGVVTYTASIGIGTPPTNYSLIVDTGSSNTWVGAGKPFTPTSSTTATGQVFQVTYGSGSVLGLELSDTVRLTEDLILNGQSIGDAISATGFQGVDGILGLGPTGLTEGTVVGLGGSITGTVPTVVDNACSNLDTCEIGIWFRPSASGESAGEIFYGGADRSKYTGEMDYTPITDTSPASKYWGIDQSITYSTSAQSILSLTAGIVDTGTTLILLATDAFDAYREATGGVPDSGTGLLKLTPDQFNNLQSLFFNVGGVTFELTPDAQIWPVCLNEDIGGTSDSIYLVVNDLGQNSGSGLDFINGYTFLERFYSAYDTTNKRVGLATTPYTMAVVNNSTRCSGH
ncbi:hypothetical protein APHAL10511_002456 [Amanita phalloides]|nr:hypothetical protein APHAL10511_002456 [Amanita phalloides]